VLRDSFLYVAEDYRFQIVNVARPRCRRSWDLPACGVLIWRVSARHSGYVTNLSARDSERCQPDRA